MKNLITVVICLLSHPPLNACVWVPGTTIDGDITISSGVAGMVLQYRRAMESIPGDRATRLLENPEAQHSEETLAVASIFSGDYEEAIAQS